MNVYGMSYVPCAYEVLSIFCANILDSEVELYSADWGVYRAANTADGEELQ